MRTPTVTSIPTMIVATDTGEPRPMITIAMRRHRPATEPASRLSPPFRIDYQCPVVSTPECRAGGPGQKVERLAFDGSPRPDSYSPAV
jgi:hypothetical protein